MPKARAKIRYERRVRNDEIGGSCGVEKVVHHVQLEIQQLLFNDKMCFVLNIHEITALMKLDQLKVEQKIQQVYQTTVSH